MFRWSGCEKATSGPIRGLDPMVSTSVPPRVGTEVQRQVRSFAFHGPDTPRSFRLCATTYRPIRAAAVINQDIDELVMNDSGGTLFDLLEVSTVGAVAYDGRTIEAVRTSTSDVRRFSDYFHNNKTRAGETPKWVVAPSGRQMPCSGGSLTSLGWRPHARAESVTGILWGLTSIGSSTGPWMFRMMRPCTRLMRNSRALWNPSRAQMIHVPASTLHVRPWKRSGTRWFWKRVLRILGFGSIETNAWLLISALEDDGWHLILRRKAPVSKFRYWAGTPLRSPAWRWSTRT
ncbi:hypothetical protein E9229_003604 [Paeniglutamicibacter cryotolerans]|uniref:Uncharacterized protein n=1 Tax=Paeniglutamicibacter cryotolerans TaxID=670079 RepID=A0A839QN71_9MICC|nr:hypothetical protein [Paeniglutamicibacter cryotolerans]